jgi:phage repressor protein C with HTH and peptisase S24 domain/DNA-binding XRE family transcriptional regulator
MSNKKIEGYNNFSERLRALRQKLEMTQTELAAELKINRSYLSQIENGLQPSTRLQERVEILEKIGVIRPEAETSREDGPVAPRLAAWRKRMFLDSAEAARALRIARSRYEEYEAGREPNRFFTEKFNALESQSRTVIERLLCEGDSGEVARVAEELSPDDRQAMDDLGADALQLHWIPLISWAHAGRSLDGDFSDVVNWEQRVPTPVKDPNAIAVQIRGDSMEPKISEGDTVILLCSVRAQTGDVVVARLKNGGVICKIFHLRGRTGRKFVLTSYNPAYPPTEHEEEDFYWIYPVHSVNKPMRR